MLIYDVLHKEKVYRSVASDLRNLGVKHRLKKNAIKSEKSDRNRNNCSRKVFKVSLSYQPLDVVNLSSGAIVHVPVFVCQATAYLENFLSHEGLFRKAGSHARQRELIARLDAGGSLGEKNHAIDVANCLKTFFRDLPEPLIPYAYHDLFVRCLVLRSGSVDALLLACILLPPLHLNTLAYFMGFLKKVSLHESLNKMSAENLATVVGPNIMPLQETTMSAVQSRLDAHLVIVKILIENARDIGVLPEHISEAISAEAIGSVETEMDNSDSASRARNKKKKHRSGSLTRMFNGLRKMVGKSGSPGESAQTNNQLALAQLDPLHTPSIKIGKKRKVVEPAGPVSVKKKRDILDAMPKRTNSRPLLESPVCSNPNPREKSPVHKSKVRKYLTQKVHSEMRVFDKVEKPKKIRLSLERLYSRSKQRIADNEAGESSKETYSPCIERRWSSPSGASATKKNHADEASGVMGKRTPAAPLMRKTTEIPNVRDDYDCIFMDADVNLSDDCAESTKQRIKIVATNEPIEAMKNHRSVNYRRSLDPVLLSETMRTRTSTERATPRHDKHLRSICRRLSGNELTKNSTKLARAASNLDNCVFTKITKNEDYVSISKSEYEDIKSRVSAIESRISQEFGCIASESVVTETKNSVSKVQSEYEKTLDEASIESTINADNLAKRLSRELKIRRSSENRIIRSPSARKIGILRRRSQEKVPTRRVSRNASWHAARTIDSRVIDKNSIDRRGNVYRTAVNDREINRDFRRETGTTSDSLCSDETNARLNYLQEQLHTLINHTAEHTRGSFSDDENCPGNGDDDENDDIFQLATNKLNPQVARRASSFHGNELIDNSRYFNNRVKELKKANSQQNISIGNDRRVEDETLTRNSEKMKTITWKDAAGYFKSEIRSNFRTPVQQTGRASVAKLRAQNAGMVLAKAKLFDENETRRIAGSETTKIEKKIRISDETRIRQTGRTIPRSRELRNHEGDASSRKIATPQRRKQSSKSPRNNNARMRISASPGNCSPLIKMELTILPSQRDSRMTSVKCPSRRNSQKFDRENHEIERFSDERYDDRANVGDRGTNENSNVRDNERTLISPMTNFSVGTISRDDDADVCKPEANSACKTPHIKRSLATKTPRSAKSLARRPIVDTRRTPLKAVPTLATPRRQSPRNVLKSRQLSKPMN